MINLSLDELKLIAKIRNINHYGNKSKEDLIKALIESDLKLESPKPKTRLKPEIIPKPKSEIIPKQTPKPETKIEIKVNSKKFKKLKKDFDEVRHKFSNKDEIRDYRKAFHSAKNYGYIYDRDIKKYRHLSESEIGEVRKNLNKLKKSLKPKKFQGNIDSVDFKDLHNYNNNYHFGDDDKYRKIGSTRTLFKEIDRDYYKPIKTDDGFAGK